MRLSMNDKTRTALSVGAMVVAAGFLAGCSLIVAQERSEGFCGDGVKDPQEQCDQGDFGDRNCEWYNGTGSVGELHCNGCEVEIHDCSGGGSCPNGHCGPHETSINCPQDCPVCGDGIRGYGEECDRNDLGTMTCEDLGYGGGILRCDGFCYFDTSDCTVLQSRPDGAACIDNANCLGGICWPNGHEGNNLVNGYCTGECYDSVCPGGGICFSWGPGGDGPFCYKHCGDVSDCRFSYECVVVDVYDICWRP